MKQNTKKKINKSKSTRDFMDADIIRGADNNDFGEVMAALNENADDITKTDANHRMTALHYAAGKGNSSMVDYLLEQPGVDTSLRDVWGRDPLDVAIIAGNPRCVNALFKHNMDLLDAADAEEETKDGSPSVHRLKPR